MREMVDKTERGSANFDCPLGGGHWEIELGQLHVDTATLRQTLDITATGLQSP